jgi:hypothetical protein
LERANYTEIRRLADAVREIGVSRAHRSPNEATKFVELLSRSGALKDATSLASEIVRNVPQTRADRPNLLRLRSLACATSLEYAAASAEQAGIASAVSEWKTIVEEIRKDDAENAEARQPLAGLRL